MAGKRGWWRAEFSDHPLYIARQSKINRPLVVWANEAKDKVRCICSPCLRVEVGRIMQEEENDLRTGRILVTREYNAISLALFNTDPSVPHKWIESRPETMINHLKDCSNQTMQIRNRALAHLESENSGRQRVVSLDIQATPRAQRFYTGIPDGPVMSGDIPTIPPFLINGSNTTQFTGSTHQFPAYPQALSSYTSSPMDIVSNHLIHPTNRQAMHAPSSYELDNTLGSGNTTRSNSPAMSFMSGFASGVQGGDDSHPTWAHYDENSPSQGSHFPENMIRRSSIHSGSLKRQRTNSNGLRSVSSQPSLHGSDFQSIPTWNKARQARFEEKLARITASAGFPLSWVEDPEFVEFCSWFIPEATVPSRKSLTQRILPGTLTEIRKGVRNRAKGATATVQCDGWTGENMHHFQAFMITANRSLFTVQVNDTTTERKTAENLLVLMDDVIEKLHSEWGVKVIAFTTDASGESRKARRLLQEKRPDLVVPDCYAHQINLIVGDYFKVNNSDFLKHAGKANDLITWLRSKTAILGLIRDALVKNGRKPLSVIRPVPTRWTAFYLAYRRILELRTTLELIVSEDAMKALNNRMVISGNDRAARKKAEAMVSIIRDPIFWHAIVRIKNHLSPLAIAANVTQSTFCRLDEVLLTFGSLVMDFSNLSDIEDIGIKKAVIASVEKRWAKSDQEVFIAAVMLNPFLKLECFKKERLLAFSNVFALMSKLYKRFFGVEAPVALYGELKNYFANTGDYEYMDTVCNNVKGMAAEKNKNPDPLTVYDDIKIPNANQEDKPLVQLATQILSICPNSASCERLFSTFGLILTKLRSRLGTQRLLDIAELKMHLRDEHIRSNTKQTLTNRKRAFGVAAESATQDIPGTISQQPHSELVAAPEAISEPISDGAATTNESSVNSSSVSLARLTTNFINDSTEVDQENIGEEDEYPSDNLKIKISDLFDFTSSHWVATQRRSASNNLEAELELYDLLELDGTGEPDLDPDLGDIVEALFSE